MEENCHDHVIYTSAIGLKQKLIPHRTTTCILMLQVFDWVEFFQLRYIFLILTVEFYAQFCGRSFIHQYTNNIANMMLMLLGRDLWNGFLVSCMYIQMPSLMLRGKQFGYQLPLLLFFFKQILFNGWATVFNIFIFLLLN